MVIVGILTWWYSAGFVQALHAVGGRLAGWFDFFSIDLLIKTLFSPFRQISAGRVDGPLVEQLKAFGDKLLSRVIGAVVRTIVMIIGICMLAVISILGLLYLLLWLVMPLLPLIGLTLALTGWVPWRF